MLPVAIFAYQRPIHLRRCWQSLRQNPEASKTRLYIFVDGAKGQEDMKKRNEVIQETRCIQGFFNVEIMVREKNLGLSGSVLEAVAGVLGNEPAAIFVEDDLEVSPFFLKYMNEATAIYQDHPAVASVHGYVYPSQEALPETFFMRGADCWGWATWRSAWKMFEPDGAKLLAQLRARSLEKEFDLGGVGPFSHMLQQQIQGKNDSWAIRWHASAFLAGLNTLYPGRSLVNNTGLDSSGTHCGTSQNYNSQLSQRPIRVEPIPVVESEIGRKAFEEFFNK